MTAEQSIRLAAANRRADFTFGVIARFFAAVLLICLGTLAVWGTYRVIAGAPDLDAVCVEAARYSGCVKWQKL